MCLKYRSNQEECPAKHLNAHQFQAKCKKARAENFK